jgi:glycosyltransferase involved in cell wall biosynthesis
MLKKGHKVWACAGEPCADVKTTLSGWGVTFEPIHLSRAGMSPSDDLRTFWELCHVMRKLRPDLVMTYTIKPVIWGGLAAWLTGVNSVYSLITGLGYAFMHKKEMRSNVAGLLATLLYRMSLKKSRKVFFQNPDDMKEFITLGLVEHQQCVIVNGSGVDLTHYDLSNLPSAPCFLMICRLLKDKGVREYIQAARKINELGPGVSFRLAGALDSNPSAISQRELKQWVSDGIIDYLGELPDVRPAIAASSIYVLPSYYEGTPRTVLEAMSMGRPIITTNAAGCRETIRMSNGEKLDKDSKEVVQGENGFLIPVRDVDKMVEAIWKFLENPYLIKEMGKKSREIAEEKYDVNKVNQEILRGMSLV